MDASRELQSSPGVLWVVFWEALGVSWGVLTLIYQICESEEVFEAKTATYSKMTYFTALLLCFRGPKGSKMSSKSTKNVKKKRREKKSRLAG